MKRQNQLNIKRGLLSKLVLLVALFLGSSNAWGAEETLTINNPASPSTSYYIPFYSAALVSGIGSAQFIIPSTSLGDMTNGEISKMKFYLSAGSTLNSAEHTVYLKEVANTTFTSLSYENWEEMQSVYSGALTISNSVIEITFSSAFSYKGGNLLIGFKQTKNATATPSPGTKFEGVNVSGNVAVGYKFSSLGYTSFLPKITFTYTTGEVETPRLSVSPTTLSFGSMRESDTETITVSNTGVGTMDVTISNSNTTDFTISTTSLTGISAGESKTFDVTFNYNGESLGDKSTTITVTPSYDAGDAKGIDVTATAADASIWEDFESGIPSTWYNENGSWLNYVSGLEGWASPGYNSTHVLRTPRLYAEEGQTLGFDVKITGKYSSNKVTASYSTDRVTWSTPVDYTTDGSYSIEAPATGYYWVQFYASQAGIDNMTGWAIADAIHDTRLGTVTIPATGTAHGTYTASVVVKELGGSAETINAELYVGGEKVAEQTGVALGGNRDITVELSYLPTETFSGKVYIKVTGANIGTLTTDEIDVEISETPYVFDENSNVNPDIKTNSVVKILYTARQGWNTIVMPFSLSASPAYMNTIFGEGWTAYAIYSYEEGTLSFKSTTYMATTTPFLVYAPNAEAHPEGVYLQNISAGSYNWGHANINQTKGDATFKGTFQPIAAPGMDGKYGVTSNGKLGKGNDSASIKAYHAYLEIAGDAEVRILTIDSEGETTDLGFVRMVEQEVKSVYNLQGQKVEKGRKGIYIVNGKKVVIK